ncbi:uncharacterized protein G2W53_010823 [Senna tora]|uniref:Uncharacterized protein n=1 Tax=Senna tora TaxID=362788 RepID=A0A835CA74_9FABA|nr:uncharacterized protein G2W53_010823 [Senna tora]
MLPVQAGEFEFPCLFHHTSWDMELNLQQHGYGNIQAVPIWGMYRADSLANFQRKLQPDPKSARSDAATRGSDASWGGYGIEEERSTLGTWRVEPDGDKGSSAGRSRR